MNTHKYKGRKIEEKKKEKGCFNISFNIYVVVFTFLL